MPAEGEDIAHLMHRRMGMGEQQIKNYRRNLISVGEAAGVHFDFSKRTHYYNTRVGHLVMHWAESKGKQLELNEALIPTYFSEGKNVGDMRVLNDILSSIGLDGDEARQALHKDAFSQSFKIKQQRVATLGVRSIPAFIVNTEKTPVRSERSVSRRIDNKPQLEYDTKKLTLVFWIVKSILFLTATSLSQAVHAVASQFMYKPASATVPAVDLQKVEGGTPQMFSLIKSAIQDPIPLTDRH